MPELFTPPVDTSSEEPAGILSISGDLVVGSNGASGVDGAVGAVEEPGNVGV